MLRVIIIGAGLGGLACAVASRQSGLEVTVLEQAKEISAVGAGIQVPPNAGRILKHFGLYHKFLESACVVENWDLCRYADGRILHRRPWGQQMLIDCGTTWSVCHREDYLRVLLDAAIDLGAEILLDTTVQDIDFDKSEVKLVNGNVLSGDVIVGADGLWSKTRDLILGHHSAPTETGDLAYRATFTLEQLQSLHDPRIDDLMHRFNVKLWMGPEKHCIFYPIRSGTEFNLALLTPDDLPQGVNKIEGSLSEMREMFQGWDERLTAIISCIPKVLKWRLCHHEELETWCKKNIAIMGDACHPTLPYQAQGAAIAVEDGAVIGHLLGRLVRDFSEDQARQRVPEVLQLYESLRKKRTTLNARGAVANRKMYHMLDGPEQVQRDRDLATIAWGQPSPWLWNDKSSLEELLEFDVIKDCEEKYDIWKAGCIPPL